MGYFYKSTRKSWHGSDPPPLFGNAKIFTAPVPPTPPLETQYPGFKLSEAEKRPTFHISCRDQPETLSCLSQFSQMCAETLKKFNFFLSGNLYCDFEAIFVSFLFPFPELRTKHKAKEIFRTGWRAQPHSIAFRGVVPIMSYSAS